ncbi:3-hydroxyacyl-CoA dehydrogenase [Streptomyces armeniacus]|uniref:3-hydroxyacyl-CoA dehydrogenase n=1 Tax=Streptomyces armeniacus TaxID=83291 RepID=A0A345XJI1_9ACTN|nr:M14 family zinc carboxypeptidase [Streptomyces armeniacus]AXK31797.1 3-hydroxyacyl-CoA dehydrogenase [Streptomyces armeniacus]
MSAHGAPPFNDYPTVTELHSSARAFASRHPGLCGVRRIGTSRAGEELLLLSVGTPEARAPVAPAPVPAAAGPPAHVPRGAEAPATAHDHRNVLVVAGPHANERVGGATVLRLAEHVVREKPLRAAGGRNVGWHFLLCLDPDGTRVNEGAGADTGNNTLHRYHRPFFRPAGAEQPEWSPSIVGTAEETLPESRALQTVIDELRPVLQCSLHANDVGGSWVQLTREVPGLPDPFAKSAADLGIPVEIGSIDTLYWPSPGPGVFVMPGPGVPERFASLQEDAARSTWYHPHRYGGMTAVIEAPMWASRLVDDCTPVPDPGRAVRGSALRLRRRGRRVAALLDRARPLVPAEHAPVLRGAEAAVQVCPGLADDWVRISRSPVGGARAVPGVPGVPAVPALTAGHLASLAGVTWRIPLRAAAMVLGSLEGVPGRAARELRAELSGIVSAWCTAFECEFQTRWVAVDDQVRHQARTVIAVFACLSESHGLGRP